MAGCCELSNEPSGSIKGGDLLDWLSSTQDKTVPEWHDIHKVKRTSWRLILNMKAFVRFKSWPGDHLYWLRFFGVNLWPSRQILAKNLKIGRVHSTPCQINQYIILPFYVSWLTQLKGKNLVKQTESKKRPDIALKWLSLLCIWELMVLNQPGYQLSWLGVFCGFLLHQVNAGTLN